MTENTRAAESDESAESAEEGDLLPYSPEEVRQVSLKRLWSLTKLLFWGLLLVVGLFAGEGAEKLLILGVSALLFVGQLIETVKLTRALSLKQKVVLIEKIHDMPSYRSLRGISTLYFISLETDDEARGPREYQVSKRLYEQVSWGDSVYIEKCLVSDQIFTLEVAASRSRPIA